MYKIKFSLCAWKMVRDSLFSLTAKNTSVVSLKRFSTVHLCMLDVAQYVILCSASELCWKQNLTRKQHIQSCFGEMMSVWNTLRVQMDNREVDCEWFEKFLMDILILFLHCENLALVESIITGWIQNNHSYCTAEKTTNSLTITFKTYRQKILPFISLHKSCFHPNVYLLS